MKTTVNESNIFEKGMLINLSMGSYAGRKKLSEEQLKGLPKEIVRGVFDLFESAFKDKLKAINQYDTETRSYLKHSSIPFPIDGIYFLLHNHIEGIIEYLEKRKINRLPLIEDVLNNYENAIKSFSKKYPDYYQKAQSKYLSKEQLKKRFYFDFQFLKITAPDKNSSFISPEQYKKEMEKFRQTIQEMKQEVVGIIYQSLSSMTNRLKKQSKDGKMNQRTFNNLNKLFEKIDNTYSDFIDRKDIQETINKIKKEIKGVDADSLRDNDAQRNKFHKAMIALTSQIKALPDVETKRAIDF